VQISSFPILLCFIVSVVVAILFLPSLRLPLEYGIYVQAATAAQITTTTTTTITSPDLAKVIIDNAIQELQSDNINKTITHLRAYEQELSLALTGNNNHDRYFPFQSLSTLLLVKDIIQSLENGDTTRAAVFLNLADQQLGRTLLNTLLLPDATNITAAIATAHIPTGTFLTYTNSKYGIKIQYQYNWIVEGNDYPTGAGGIQIASFYLPDVNNGLPFFRIGVDNVTKEFQHLPAVSINEYLNRSLDHKNSTGFPGFKLIKYNTNNSLAGNRAYTVVWTYTHPTYGIRKSIEIATVIGSKGYFVDYTAAAAKFSNYLPTAQEMIESFGIIK
jgi:hypothetical protein